MLFAQLTGRRPKTSLKGPQIATEKAMQAMYTALLRSTIDPVVLNPVAISGIAANTAVLEIGDRNAQNDKPATIKIFWQEVHICRE